MTGTVHTRCRATNARQILHCAHAHIHPTTPLPANTPHKPSCCRVSSLVLSSLPCDLSIQPISSRRDQRRRTRPAVIVTVTIAQTRLRHSELQSSKQQSNASNTTTSSSFQRHHTATRRLTRYSARGREGLRFTHSTYHLIYKDRVDLVAERPHPPNRSHPSSMTTSS